ncbi:MAG: hypothetical protein IKZ58_09270 [Selenomonadaceae bacterium]|nr:hypothetical protein [Selenomonadaceae bacterium]
MKKFLSALVFVIVCGIFNFCSAYDYYVGNYKGAEKYLMTETIKKIEEHYSDHTSGIDFYFKVKAVYKDSVQIDDYHCDFPGGEGFFEVNGKRVGSRVGDNEHTIIERNIIDYLVENF